MSTKIVVPLSFEFRVKDGVTKEQTSELTNMVKEYFENAVMRYAEPFDHLSDEQVSWIDFED